MNTPHQNSFCMSAVFALFLTLFLGSPVAMAEEKAGVLDGMAFVGEVGRMGDSSGDPDEMTFKDGLFHSKACDPLGFGKGVYKATSGGNITTFWAETISPTEGRITWKGAVIGDKVEGYFVWHKAPKWYRLGSSTAEYWFKAQLKK